MAVQLSAIRSLTVNVLHVMQLDGSAAVCTWSLGRAEHPSYGLPQALRAAASTPSSVETLLHFPLNLFPSHISHRSFLTALGWEWRMPCSFGHPALSSDSV